MSALSSRVNGDDHPFGPLTADSPVHVFLVAAPVASAVSTDITVACPGITPAMAYAAEE